MEKPIKKRGTRPVTKKGYSRLLKSLYNYYTLQSRQIGTSELCRLSREHGIGPRSAVIYFRHVGIIRRVRRGQELWEITVVPNSLKKVMKIHEQTMARKAYLTKQRRESRSKPQPIVPSYVAETTPAPTGEGMLAPLDVEKLRVEFEKLLNESISMVLDKQKQSDKDHKKAIDYNEARIEAVRVWSRQHHQSLYDRAKTLHQTIEVYGRRPKKDMEAVLASLKNLETKVETTTGNFAWLEKRVADILLSREAEENNIIALDGIIKDLRKDLDVMERRVEDMALSRDGEKDSILVRHRKMIDELRSDLTLMDKVLFRHVNPKPQTLGLKTKLLNFIKSVKTKLFGYFQTPGAWAVRHREALITAVIALIIMLLINMYL